MQVRDPKARLARHLLWLSGVVKWTNRHVIPRRVEAVAAFAL